MARHEFTQRRRALDVIFEAEQKDILVPGLLRELLAERRTVSTHQVPIQDLGADYVNLVAAHLYEVDGMIEDYSKWGLRRLSSLDRAVLRLGIAEICFAGTPVAEAVLDYSEMVRELGSEKSIGFITAIFNRAKSEAVRDGDEQGDEREDQPAEDAESAALSDGGQADGSADDDAPTAVPSPASAADETETTEQDDPDTVDDRHR